MNKIVKNICVDAGMIMIADHDFFQERNPDYMIESRLNKKISIPEGKYKISWKIPETWNGEVVGDGFLNVTSGQVVITDPCYILGHVTSNPNFWMEWLNETDYGKDPPFGTLILDKMGGDGEYDIYLNFELLKDKEVVKPYSISKWICEDCKLEAETTYKWMEQNGTLVCNECDRDMIFESERWVETPKEK